MVNSVPVYVTSYPESALVIFTTYLYLLFITFLRSLSVAIIPDVIYESALPQPVTNSANIYSQHKLQTHSSGDKVGEVPI